MATATATFINPPPFENAGNYEDLPSFGIGTMLNVRWTTEVYETELWLLQDGDGNTCTELNLASMTCVRLGAANRGKSWNWPIQEPAGYTVSSPVYYLSLQDPSNRHGFGLGAAHYMNLLPQSLLSSSSSTVTTAVVTSTSSVTSAPTAGTTLSTTTSRSSGSSTTASLSSTTSGSSSDATLGPVVPTISSTPVPAGGLSSGTKVAIGVAVGVAVPLIIVLAVIAFFLYRNHNRKRNSAIHPPAYNGNTEKAYYNKQSSHNIREAYGPQEMPSPEPVPVRQNYQPVYPRAELPSTAFPR